MYDIVTGCALVLRDKSNLWTQLPPQLGCWVFIFSFFSRSALSEENRNEQKRGKNEAEENVNKIIQALDDDDDDKEWEEKLRWLRRVKQIRLYFEFSGVLLRIFVSENKFDLHRPNK